MKPQRTKLDNQVPMTKDGSTIPVDNNLAILFDELPFQVVEDEYMKIVSSGIITSPIVVTNVPTLDHIFVINVVSISPFANIFITLQYTTDL